MSSVAEAGSRDFWARTRLINLSDSVPLSQSARSMSRGGYELSGGAPITFEKWYRRKGASLYAELRTELRPDLGLLWGFSTGERGEKYTIDPAVSLGLHYTRGVGRRGAFALVARTWIAGKLREKSCTADYGQIGGIARVNCRLAAGLLAPEETLNYLVSERPDWLDLRLLYQISF